MADIVSVLALAHAPGATGWLVKPFDPPKLLEVVKKVIG